MAAVADSKLLTIHVADLPEVTRHVRKLTARVEELEAENERLKAGQRQDAAGQARACANAWVNLH